MGQKLSHRKSRARWSLLALALALTLVSVLPAQAAPRKVAGACAHALSLQAKDRELRASGGIPDRDANASAIRQACLPGQQITLRPPAAFYVEQLCDLDGPITTAADGATNCALRK